MSLYQFNILRKIYFQLLQLNKKKNREYSNSYSIQNSDKISIYDQKKNAIKISLNNNPTIYKSSSESVGASGKMK